MPTVEENHRYWNDEHDWTRLGEEWTPTDPRWKEVVLRYTVERYLAPDMRVLEIGPGAGRWTAELLRFKPSRLTGIDVSQRCLEMCRRRFAGRDDVEFLLNDGQSLPSVADGSIDFVWSFDVFVHFELDTIRAYFREFRRVLRDGGIGVVHYPSIDRAKRENPRSGMRGAVTSADMLGVLGECSLALLHDYYEPWISETNTSVVVFRG
jgi:ubiquinone/menaquinone biosynthesis C-methylase UbiE